MVRIHDRPCFLLPSHSQAAEPGLRSPGEEGSSHGRRRGRRRRTRRHRLTRSGSPRGRQAGQGHWRTGRHEVAPGAARQGRQHRPEGAEEGRLLQDERSLGLEEQHDVTTRDGACIQYLGPGPVRLKSDDGDPIPSDAIFFVNRSSNKSSLPQRITISNLKLIVPAGGRTATGSSSRAATSRSAS